MRRKRRLTYLKSLESLDLFYTLRDIRRLVSDQRGENAETSRLVDKLIAVYGHKARAIRRDCSQWMVMGCTAIVIPEGVDADMLYAAEAPRRAPPWRQAVYTIVDECLRNGVSAWTVDVYRAKRPGVYTFVGITLPPRPEIRTVQIHLRDHDSPDSESEPEERKKGTDEVAPSQSETSDEKHGGENSSGEVDAPSANPSGNEGEGGEEGDTSEEGEGGEEGNGGEGAGASSEESSQGDHAESEPGADSPCSEPCTDSSCGSGGRGVSKGASEQSEGVAPDSLDLNGEDEPTGGEPTLGGSTPASEDDLSKEDRGEQPRSDSGAADSRDEVSSGVEKLDPSFDDLLRGVEPAEGADTEPSVPEGQVSAPGRRGNGGFYLSEGWSEIAKKASGRPAREVKRALERLLRSVEVGGLEESPRLDGRRFIGEMYTRRYNLDRCHRRELQRGVVVVAVDCSGSCSACCDELYGVVLALMECSENLILIEHSNGEVATEPVSNWYGEWHRSRLDEVVEKIAKSRPVRAVINLGDWDAGQEMENICESGIPLYWLDSYCAKSGPKPASSNLRGPARHWKHQPKGWWQGVGDATSTAIAMRDMAKGGRR